MYSVVKRLFDIIFSLLVALIFLPFFLLLLPLLLFSGEGDIFYCQKRIGFQNATFFIIKFATMLRDSPNIGTGMITLRNDSRVTFAGKFLRKTKLNEVPQIFNVLKGDMSFVGPRPLGAEAFESYSEDVKMAIYRVKPGITGIGSIVFRDEEELISNSRVEPNIFYEQVIAPYKGELEIWYQKNQSFKTDFLILSLTVWQIIFPKSKLVSKVFRTLPARNFNREQKDAS